MPDSTDIALLRGKVQLAREARERGYIGHSLVDTALTVRDVETILAAYDTAARERDELQRTMDLVVDSDVRAMRAWRAERPVTRRTIFPDRARLIVWLMRRLDAFGPGGQRWRHRARGTTYEVLGEALLQVSDTRLIADGARIVLYQDLDTDHKLYARHGHEFYDGRFEQVTVEEEDPWRR